MTTCLQQGNSLTIMWALIPELVSCGFSQDLVPPAGWEPTFFMSESELVRQLEKILEDGFEPSFAGFCAKEFSSHSYPQENLAAARMHAFYLRLSMEVLTERREYPARISGDPVERAFWIITAESKRAALESGRPFCELFVEKWCRFFAEE